MHTVQIKTKIVDVTIPNTKWYLKDLVWVYTPVLDESRSFFRVHTGYFSNIPKCIKAEFIASWACSQSSVVSKALE
ncbi:hypothetical protein TNCV_583401 [Trichonephila clavipes]|nr:hypothetical protein TNCV_583401 [Trichonephila clavipes]